MSAHGVNVGADASQKTSPPYIPTTWALGGLNKRSIDLPITCVLLVCYIGSAVTHMTIFQLNNRRGHKFLFNAAMFGFSMSRIVTCVLRIASICLATDVSLAIAASIFIAAGILLIYIINILWAFRIVRALHPRIGWHPSVSIGLKVFYVVLVLTLATLITATVQTFYTLNKHYRHIDRCLQLYGQTFMGVVSCAPIVILAIAFAVPRRTIPERFGAGRLRTKIIVLLTGSSLLTLGAWYRCGTSWHTPVPRTQPMPKYFHKAAFYCVDFVVEILVVYMYAIVRVDLRFWIPNGAKGPGSYEVYGNTALLDSEAATSGDGVTEKVVDKEVQRPETIHEEVQGHQRV